MTLDSPTDLDLRMLATEDRARYLLPPEAYFSPEWYEREQRELFARTWNLVAYEADLANPGDYLPVNVGFEPILLMRGRDGEIRGFVNMCRHRGMALACEAGHTDGNIRCFYHGWEFDPGGTLVRIPQRSGQFADVDPSQWGLIPLPTASYDGMVFVHPSGDAEPFDLWLDAYPAHRGPFDVSQLEEVFRLKVPIQCNWKLYIENHIDVLHLWYLHDETLGMYDHANFNHHKLGLHWVSDERLREGETRESNNRNRSLPRIEHLPTEELDVLRANLIFPNVPTSSSDTLTMTYQVIPTGPTTSELDIRIRAQPGSELTDAGRLDLLKVLVDEDGFAVEQVQRVLRSKQFGVGPLASVHEKPITDFHRDLLTFLP